MARKPHIDPVRWQPPPVDPLPDMPSPSITVVPLPGNGPEDVASSTRPANCGRGLEDGRIVRIPTDGGEPACPQSYCRHRRATARSAHRSRRPGPHLRQPSRIARPRLDQRHAGRAGRIGRWQAAQVLLQRHRDTGRHNLFQPSRHATFISSTLAPRSWRRADVAAYSGSTLTAPSPRWSTACTSPTG